MAVHNLLDLDEPAYILNGILLPTDGATDVVEVVEGDGRKYGWPTELRTPLTYFSRLRTRSQALSDGPAYGFDADDLDALVEHGLLWRLLPGRGPEQIGPGVVYVRAPLAENQNRPGFVVLDLGDGWVTQLSEPGAALLAAASGHELGPVVADAARRAGVDPEPVWWALGVDLAKLLGSGAGAVSVGAG